MQRFAVDRMTACARFANRLHARGCAHVHHVDGGFHLFGQADDPAKREILGERVMDFRHVFEAGAAFAEQLFIHVHDDVVILGVDDPESALTREHAEHFPDIAKADHPALAARGDVGGENLHRGIAGPDGLGHLIGEADGEQTLDHQVIGEVGMAAPDPLFVAGLDRSLDRAAVHPAREIDHRGRAAEQGGAADVSWIGGLVHAAVWPGDMPCAVHVGIDATRYDNLAHGVDEPHAGGRGERPPRRDGGDVLALDGNVVITHALRGYDPITANDHVYHCGTPVGGPIIGIRKLVCLL